MYMCICNAVTEGQVKQAIKNGANSLCRLESELNIATCSGSCAEGAQQMLQAALSEEVPAALVAPVLSPA